MCGGVIADCIRRDCAIHCTLESHANAGSDDCVQGAARLSIEEFGYKEQLHRALTTKDLIIYGLIFMVPIAPFAVFGFV